jgi:hypothetical protein
MKDSKGKGLKKGDTVTLRGGSTGLWIVAGFDDGVDLENMAGQKLNRAPCNVTKLSA